MKHDILEFQTLDNSTRCINKAMVGYFFINKQFIAEGMVEVTPLTITRLVRAVIANFLSMNYWRLMYILNRIGILKTPEGHIMSWKDLWFLMKGDA